MKIIITIIVIVLVLFLIIGFYNAGKLTTIEINKSVTINASKTKVYPMVSLLQNYPKWSPFLAQDPTQKYWIKGTDGIVGAQYHWEGNKGKDLGYQEIIELTPDDLVGIKCVISKPFTAEPSFNYTFEATENGVIVNQNFKIESGLVDAFFLWLFGVKKEMEKTNQQGLDLLKMASEA